jgi:hypothetical protein
MGDQSWAPENQPSVDDFHDAAAALEQAATYGRVVDFEGRILEEMLVLRERADAAMRPLIDASNIEPLRRLIEDFEARRQKLLRRAAELSDRRIEPDTQTG